MTTASAALAAHPSETVDDGWMLEVRLRRDGDCLQAVFALRGPLQRLCVPPPAPPRARDGLWRHTCFELFVGAVGDAAYHEFNLAPSGEWAHYAFRATRERDEQPGAAPAVAWRRGDGCLEADTTVALGPLGLADAALRIGVSAVLETAGGALSHWAAAHPAPQPDFHHPDAFALHLT